jgi:hypothetical protein
MLKFSGYPYLIRGQPYDMVVFWQAPVRAPKRERLLRSEPDGAATDFGTRREPATPNSKRCLMVVMTLEQAYPPEYQRVQCAFKDSMIH